MYIGVGMPTTIGRKTKATSASTTDSGNEDPGTFFLLLIWVSEPQIGFDWVCFPGAAERNYSHNPLIYLILHPFDFFLNWLCFAKKQADL